MSESWEAVPGFVSVKEQHGETTLVVEREQLIEACTHLRDEEGFNFLSDVSAADYLDWGAKGVAGYIGTSTGRDLNMPMTQGLQVMPETKPKRFAMNYHLLSISDEPRRLRVQTWLDEDEAVASVVEIWPTADWHEREAYDFFGIEFTGRAGLRRLIMPDDWEGHPLRKDYPLGGVPVEYKGAEIPPPDKRRSYQ